MIIKPHWTDKKIDENSHLNNDFGEVQTVTIKICGMNKLEIKIWHEKGETYTFVCNSIDIYDD